MSRPLSYTLNTFPYIDHSSSFIFLDPSDYDTRNVKIRQMKRNNYNWVSIQLYTLKNFFYILILSHYPFYFYRNIRLLVPNLNFEFKLRTIVTPLCNVEGFVSVSYTVKARPYDSFSVSSFAELSRYLLPLQYKKEDV